MLNDVTAGHPTNSADVITTLAEVFSLYERGNDQQALHLLDVLIDGVEVHLTVPDDEIKTIVNGLVQIANQIEAEETDVDDFVRELSDSLRAV
jgi:hypothetical protein